MPSTATITSSGFVDFVAGTRIKSAEVDGNFAIFRGHLIPVEADTSAASDLEHDLGSSTHRWRNIYAGNISTGVVSTTGSMALTTTSSICLMDASSATITATLPTAVGNDGLMLTIKNIGTGGFTVYVDGNASETIDNTLTTNLVDSESTTLVAKSSKWWSI